MEIRNETPFAHGIAVGMGPDRAAHLGVVVKGTFRIPERPGGAVEVADEQRPVATADEHHRGDPTASVRVEGDAVVFKPRADVVLAGHAYAPRGRPVAERTVGLRVGRLERAIRVVGDRRWRVAPLTGAVTASPPEPFAAMPLTFERAYGGFDHEGKGGCLQNPVGRGYLHAESSADGAALPNLEDPRHPVRRWDDRPAPVGWGVFGRAWSPRSALAGRATERHPVFGLPADFDPAFHNGAHPALQVPYLAGDEAVALRGVTPDGPRRFALPGRRPRIALQTRGAAANRALRPVLDTLVLLPDDGVLTLTWRASLALALDLDQALALVAAVHIADGRPTG
ncbi:DUF2169 domain-containing protein [Rubrivirga sp. IMCC45206]|uniref:DUF2169 family type VI secretion system accessory protein n=1 Tax=Rubrivirga sp. IMCC45206 TaxID=3391614 RepID=UPI00398FB669